MATTSQLTRYPCNTQGEDDLSSSAAPVSDPAGTNGDKSRKVPDSIVLGYRDMVPRWDVKSPGGRKLQYFVATDSFPSPTRAKLAAKAFQDAANSWNALELGISIVETTAKEIANFDLVYKVNPPYRPDRDTLAEAFFPHEADSDVIVFSRAFDDEAVLKNVFEHEIGHILGLRHEFAITGDRERDLRPEDENPVQFLENNPKSVMSYNYPPNIQDSDKKQVAQFYKLANGYKISGSPVTDYVPQVRRRN